MAGRLAACALLAWLSACRASPSPSAPSRPRVEPLTPADFLPNDLDFVVRIDLDRLRSEPSAQGAARELARAAGSGMLKSVLPTLERARAILAGARFMSDGFHGDGVVAIEGSRVAAAEGGVDASFRRVGGGPKDLELYERATESRDEAALQIALDGGGIVLATAAEADAVLRIVRSGPDDDRLDPPARGLASFAGRFPFAASANATTGVDASANANAGPGDGAFLRAIGRGLLRYAGAIEGGDGLRIEAELFYATQDDAEQAATRVRLLAGRLADAPAPLRSLSDSTQCARVDRALRIRATVPFALLAQPRERAP